MFPRLTNPYKKFDGVEFVHWDWYKHRNDALQVAHELREEGYKVRMTFATSQDKGKDRVYYALWKYPITSIKFHREHEEAAKINLAKMVKSHSTILTGDF